VVSIRKLLSRAEATAAGSAPRPGFPACPIGSAGRAVCMQDPNRLAHWPEICRTCNQEMRSRQSYMPTSG
jgi:hypothetical protein